MARLRVFSIYKFMQFDTVTLARVTGIRLQGIDDMPAVNGDHRSGHE